MKLKEFEDELQKLRAQNGWVIILELRSIWIITVFDKETGKKLAETGSTGLSGVIKVLKMPFDQPPWV